MKKPTNIDLGFKINFDKLWALDLPVESVDIQYLSYNFDIPYLEEEGTDDWNLSINLLLDNLENETTHAHKMQASSLDYPIDIYNFHGNWIILDGVHRLAKAIYEKRGTINVRRVSEADILLVRK